MDCSLPGFPALYHLPEFAQTHGPGEGRAKEPDGVGRLVGWFFTQELSSPCTGCGR